MSGTNIYNSIAEKTQAEAKDMVLSLYASMSPERFMEHMTNLQDLARESGRDNEREELVCRLLASGMPAEEVAVVLCLRLEAVQIIEQNNAATTIPDYAKKLKERRKRREKKSTK